MMKRKNSGGVMLYVLVIAVGVGIGLSMVARQTGNAYIGQRKEENNLVAKYAASAAIAKETSATNLAGKAASGSYTTTYNGISVTVNSTPTITSYSPDLIERTSATASYRGANVNITREPGSKRAANYVQWNFATRILGSDFLADNTQTLLLGTGAPDWLGPKLSSIRTNTAASLTFYDFSLGLEAGNWWGSRTFVFNKGSAANSPYDICLILANGEAPDLINFTVEIQKGTSRVRVSNIPAQGTNCLILTPSWNDHQFSFMMNDKPATVTDVRQVFIDLDAYSGGTALMAATGDLQVTAYRPAPTGTAGPRIDAVAYRGPTEQFSNKGYLAEYNSTLSNGYWPYQNVWDPSGPDYAYVKRIDTTPDIIMSSSNYAHVIGADSQYWFINYWSKFTAPSTGTYTFSSNGWADNGFWIFVNGQIVFNSQTGFNPGISLTAGQTVDLLIENYDGGGWYQVLPLFNVNGGGWQSFTTDMSKPGFGSALIYHNNFEAGDTSGWTWDKLRTAADGAPYDLGITSLPASGILTFAGGKSKVGADINCKSLGDFGGTGNFAKLALGSQPAGKYILTFDAVLHSSWDGTGSWGPDMFRVDATGTTVFNRGIMDVWASQGNDTNSTWRYRYNSWTGYYRTSANIEIIYSHPGGNMDLRFASENVQSTNDESWSLDNMTLKRIKVGPFE